MKPLELSDIPVMNFGRFMLDKMKPFGDKAAFIDGVTQKKYTFNDLIYRTKRLAAGLQGIGVSKGDAICIISPNDIDYCVLSYAVALVTAVLQPINPLYPKDDISRVFALASTKYVVTTPMFLPKVKDAIDSDTSFAHIKIIILGEAEDSCISFESLLDPSYGDYTTPECDPKTTTVSLLSSSGTTGLPKAVMLSHYGVIANALQLDAAEINDDNSIIFIPMFHQYGIYALMTSCHVSGCSLINMNKFDPEKYLQLIQKYRTSRLHLVPPIMVMLAKHPKVAEYDLSSVTNITCGAAPLSEEIETVVKNKLNLHHITQGYGLTETGITHANTATYFRHKSVGKLVQLAEVKIVGIDNGKTLGVGEEGEIWLKGPQTSIGYFHLPAQTKDMFLDDGWVRTGDIGREDEDGYLFVVDRLKELIKYKGYQVAPAYLEDILLRHDSVADVGVIGVPDEDAGELPRAFIVKKAGHDVSGSELQEFVAGFVAPHMKLRGGVEFITEIPRSASGKIIRRMLRDRAKLQK